MRTCNVFSLNFCYFIFGELKTNTDMLFDNRKMLIYLAAQTGIFGNCVKDIISLRINLCLLKGSISIQAYCREAGDRCSCIIFMHR